MMVKIVYDKMRVGNKELVEGNAPTDPGNLSLP